MVYIMTFGYDRHIMADRLSREFFVRDVLEVTPELLGKYICRKFDDGTVGRFQILEAEAYRGEEDRACHASKGRTARTEIMYAEGGHVYVFLIYGMYWMLNVVTGVKDHPEAALIRGVTGASGPGKCGRLLHLDKSFYGENLLTSSRIWLEDSGVRPPYETTPRIGIKYAGKPWTDKLWRFLHTP